MLASDIPGKFPVPFANGASGTNKTVPIPTGTTGTYRASLADGFPPQTFLAIGAGGTPPDGRDFNGLLFEISGWSRWQQAGGPIVYDGAFSAAIGGYPNGAVISTNPHGGLWLCTADNNTTDPDGGSPANWVSLIPVGLTKASVPECIAGANDTDFVTPLGLRAAIDSGPQSGFSLTSNGYYTLPGGLIAQWGAFSITGVGNRSVSFPIPFPGTCFSVSVSGGEGSAAQNNQITLVSSSVLESGFTARYANAGMITGFFSAWGI